MNKKRATAFILLAISLFLWSFNYFGILLRMGQGHTLQARGNHTDKTIIEIQGMLAFLGSISFLIGSIKLVRSFELKEAQTEKKDGKTERQKDKNNINEGQKDVRYKSRNTSYITKD